MISKALIDSYISQNKCDSVNNILKYMKEEIKSL